MSMDEADKFIVALVLAFLLEVFGAVLVFLLLSGWGWAYESKTFYNLYF